MKMSTGFSVSCVRLRSGPAGLGSPLPATSIAAACAVGRAALDGVTALGARPSWSAAHGGAPRQQQPWPATRSKLSCSLSTAALGDAPRPAMGWARTLCPRPGFRTSSIVRTPGDRRADHARPLLPPAVRGARWRPALAPAEQGQRAPGGAPTRAVRCASSRAAGVSLDQPAGAPAGSMGEELVGGCWVRHQEVRNGDVLLHYVECGDPEGHLVILLHGFPCFWRMWARQLAPLASAGLHVVVPDMRGYGLSSKPHGGLAAVSRAALVSDVRTLIDHCGGGRPASLVSHDWGGFVGWCAAMDLPGRVARLATLNIGHPAAYWAALRGDWRQTLRSYYVFLFQLPWLPEAILGLGGGRLLHRVFSSEPNKPLSQEDIRLHVQAFMRPGAATTSVNYYRAAFRGLWGSPSEASSTVHAPLLSLWGERDTYLIKELAEPPKELAPNCKVVRYPQATHWVMWDEAEAVNSELLQFLSQEKR